MKKYLHLNDIKAYKIAYHLSNFVWGIVSKWEIFSKKTIGEQFVRSVDSISANIVEGFGRYTKKDKVNFYRISKASVLESLDWNQKSKERKLLTQDQYKHILSQLEILPKEINRLIKFTNQKLKL